MSSAASADISPVLLQRFAELGPHSARPVPTPSWPDPFGSDDYDSVLGGVAQRPDETLSLHVRIPFCAGRCLYCGCNTTITHESERLDRYLDSLEREMAMVAQRVGNERDILQVHLAGGTPNYLNDAQLTRLTEMMERHFRILPDTEQSIECDPRRTSAGQLELLHALGFQRITLGVQDLDPVVQRAIGRVQSVDLVRDVYWLAREIGFESIGLDLIYGLPQQTEETFDRTLDAVLELSPDRVTCFGYSRDISQGPHHHAIDVHQLPSELSRQALFHRAVQSFTEAGYSWIGLDTFALDSDELSLAQEEKRLRRNCTGYTANAGDHTLGLGSGAVGDVDGHCVQNECALDAWEALLERGQFPVARGQRVSVEDRRRRDAISHMICNLELPADLAAGCLDDEYARLAGYEADGLVRSGPSGLQITPTGRYLLRSLCSGYEDFNSWESARLDFAQAN
ncbi:MAG: oxygen-independent coproporphyrinogen III oxidase [Thiohalocapsa sp.]